MQPTFHSQSVCLLCRQRIANIRRLQSARTEDRRRWIKSSTLRSALFQNEPRSKAIRTEKQVLPIKIYRVSGEAVKSQPKIKRFDPNKTHPKPNSTSGKGSWLNDNEDSATWRTSALAPQASGLAQLQRLASQQSKSLPTRPHRSLGSFQQRSDNGVRKEPALSGFPNTNEQFGRYATRGNDFLPSIRESPSDERERIRAERSARRRERFASQATPYQPVSENPSRGLDRDKARRREQFISSYEESERSNEEEQEREKKRLARAAKRRAQDDPVRPIKIPDFISVSQLAQAIHIPMEGFLSRMEELGFENNSADTVLNAENAGLLAMEYNFEPIVDPTEDQDLRAREIPVDQSNFPARPPIVTIMGHVDHGKTTLLDFLRRTSVVETEHGGITQHIGAFSVPMPSGKTITFLDTPGHAAFLSMRRRGANITDIVVLVVAADDSVKPQTIEAIKHAKDAGVPIIVAINKIDKPGANPVKVKQDLAVNNIELEDFGGDTQSVLVSGKTGQGIRELEDAIIALSDTIDMRAEQVGGPEGWIVEATTKAEGRTAVVLVRRGTLRIGDTIVAGSTWARVKRLRNQVGSEVNNATPGTPVEVEGWRDQPVAGDEVLAARDESHAKTVTEYREYRAEKMKLAIDTEAINESRRAENDRQQREKEVKLANKKAAKLGEARIEVLGEETDTGPKLVKFIVKGDVSGSVEAVNSSIASIGNNEVQVQVLRSGVGPVSEFDIEHAATAKGYIITFNTAVDPQMRRLAEAADVKILDHNIIYRLTNEVTEIVNQHLAPSITKKVLGEADVAKVFQINVKARTYKAVAGCKVRNGVISRNAKVRVLRAGSTEPIYDGHLDALKNVKKDVDEMRKGTECGMSFTGWNDIQEGDHIQTYEEISEKRTL